MKNTIRLGCIIACVLAVRAGAAVIAAAPNAISMTPSDTDKAFGSISIATGDYLAVLAGSNKGSSPVEASLRITLSGDADLNTVQYSQKTGGGTAASIWYAEVTGTGTVDLTMENPGAGYINAAAYVVSATAGETIEIETASVSDATGTATALTNTYAFSSNKSGVVLEAFSTYAGGGAVSTGSITFDVVNNASTTKRAIGTAIISSTPRFESSYALSGSNSKVAAAGLAFVAVPPPAGSPVLLESWQFNETPGGQELQALSNHVGTASWSSATATATNDGNGHLVITQGSPCYRKTDSLSAGSSSTGIYEMKFLITDVDLSSGAASGVSVGFGFHDSTVNADLFYVRLLKQNNTFLLGTRIDHSNATLHDFGSGVTSLSNLLVRSVIDLNANSAEVFYTLGGGSEASAGTVNLSTNASEWSRMRFVATAASPDWGATDHAKIDYLTVSTNSTQASGFDEVPLTSPELYVQGANFMNIDGNGMNFHRFDFNQPYSNVNATKAKTTSGVKLTFYTRSETVKLHFDYKAEDENRNSRFGLYQNGIQTDTPYFAKTETGIVITIDNQGVPGERIRHDVVLPNWSNPILSKMELTSGAVLEAGSPSPTEQMVVLGDSISHGTGQGASYLTYPCIAADRMDMELFNMAVGGGKIAPEVAGLLQHIDPVEAIWVLAGYNDWQGGSESATSISNDYESLLTTLRTHQPNAEVFCCTLTYTTNLDDPESGVTAVEVRQAVSDVVNARISDGDSKLHLIDGSAYSDASFLNDAVHFSEPGAAMFATNVVSIMEPIVHAPERVDSPDRTRTFPTHTCNVLFIAIDDMRPLIDAYGETEPLRPLTPEIDRLANSGVLFANAYCQQAVCNASRASLMTGLRPDTTRCWKLQTFFRDKLPNVITLPQHFGANGYRVHGIGKIYHGINNHRQDNPLSWNEGWANASTDYGWYEADKAALEDAGTKKVSATDAGEINTRDGNRPIEDADYNDGNAAEMGVAKIAEYAESYNASNQPFFLGVGFQKPHLPFNAPKTYWDLYDPNNIDLTGYTGIRRMPVGANKFTAPYGGEPSAFLDITGTSDNNMPNATEARHLIHGYLACVSFIDTQVGKLLDALEDPDGNPGTDDSIADNTMIVLWGDHGFHLGDHNGFWAKHSNYEISTRVPLIVRAPGMEATGSSGANCIGLVELVDLYPTLLDLCSLPAPAQPPGQALEGTTFLPLLEDPAQPWKKAVFSQFQRYINDNKDPVKDVPVANSGAGMGYSVRTERYRYTEWWVTDSTDETDRHIIKAGITEPGHVELYDYVADPGETTNLAHNAAYTDLMAELSALLNDSDSVSMGDGWSEAEADAPSAYPVDSTVWKTNHLAPGRSLSGLNMDADPDGDGLVNRLEYKFGTHPFEFDAPSVFSGFTNNSLYVTYPDVEARSNTLLQVTTTTDLRESWSGTGVTTTNEGSYGNATIKTGTIPANDPQRFLCLEARDH